MKEAKNKAPTGSSSEGKKKSEADKLAHICQICRQSFIVTAKAAQLVEHAHSKHPKSTEAECFPELPEMGWSAPG
eukprot:CAMPEP_0202871682 /NCGR_PEP_ID=MMETSP1391-20130828/19397_1 /ASSEMBLY_ACC=CAM_ASM_000867 /TAXON_ID=1034604 /ORGANISM="Chlamydomonas leiostraca, Strain SAG 11-49" /LENGTH=74 /DNA_ID=CAMNT_0049552561 /DNA_START=61 /DNA_END=285 /DNA_ORIENTATION=-